MSVPVEQEYMKFFRERFSESGYTDDKTADLRVLNAGGEKMRAVRAMNNMRADGNPNLVVAFGTLAAQAAAEVFGDTSVPILFCLVPDPVGSGLVGRLGEPTKDNITGRASSTDRKEKLDMVLRLIDQVRPKLKPEGRKIKVGIVSSDYPSAAGDVARIEILSERREDIRLVTRFLKFNGSEDGIKSMMESATAQVGRLGPKIDFWWQQDGPLTEMKSFTAMMLQTSNAPIALGNTMESVRMGAFLAVVPDARSEARDVADMAVEILKTGETGQIPVLSARTVDVGVNLTTARKAGITVPEDILKRAGRNIYK